MNTFCISGRRDPGQLPALRQGAEYTVIGNKDGISVYSLEQIGGRRGNYLLGTVDGLLHHVLGVGPAADVVPGVVVGILEVIAHQEAFAAAHLLGVHDQGAAGEVFGQDARIEVDHGRKRVAGLLEDAVLSQADSYLCLVKARYGRAPAPAMTRAGSLCPEWAERLGLPAGIAVSGQRELLEAIFGLYPIAAGSVLFHPASEDEKAPGDRASRELVGMDPMAIRKCGVSMAFVPEDRLGMGLVGSMGMTGNMMLRSWNKGRGAFLNRREPEDLANRIWKELDVVTPSVSFPVRRMSGGNVQKVLVGREIAQDPAVLMTAYAVRGLDINTSYTIYSLLTEEKMKGVAVIFVGEDLDVLLELCDRILVLCGGQVSGIVDGRTADKRQVGTLMTRVGGGGDNA